MGNPISEAHRQELQHGKFQQIEIPDAFETHRGVRREYTSAEATLDISASPKTTLPLAAGKGPARRLERKKWRTIVPFTVSSSIASMYQNARLFRDSIICPEKSFHEHSPNPG